MKTGTEVDTMLGQVNPCGQENIAYFKARTTDLLDESKNNEKVIIKFDSDPEDKPYELSKE